MTLPIIEQPLYGQIKIETSPWATPFVWTDQTANLVSGMNYSLGGRIGTPGSPISAVGTLNATLKNLSTVPNVGYLVRISIPSSPGLDSYAFTGYIQDVSQRIVFDNSVTLTTPITLTTLHCIDWVGYINQWKMVGAGGADPVTGAIDTSSNYAMNYRVAALNKFVDPTFSTLIINSNITASLLVGDTNLVGTLGEHLDLLCEPVGLLWYSQPILPSNITTGRTSLVTIDSGFSGNSSGKTFTDSAGSSGQLHYTEIDLENSTTNLANEVVFNNFTRFNVPDVEVTRIGGFNQENYVVINDQNVVGIGLDETQKFTDSASITTYGNRTTGIETNIALAPFATGTVNLIVNPSVEYSDEGYSGTANSRVRRREPLKDANPFAAYNGSWAMRARQTTAAATTRVAFSGGEADGIPVVGGTTYYVKSYAARGNPSRTDMFSSMTIDWYNDDEAIISSTTTGTTTLTTSNTWYLVSGSGVAPATAVRATVRLSFARSGGANIPVGDRLWGDAFMLSKSNVGYFDGDTPWDSAYGHIWTGGVGLSPSYRVANKIAQSSSLFLNRYSTTTIRVQRIRWNAQENMNAIRDLPVGSTFSLIYKGTTALYRIIGIDGSIDSERYMIDYYLQKV